MNQEKAHIPLTVRLYVTAFVGGLVSLALELAAARLLAPDRKSVV